MISELHLFYRFLELPYPIVSARELKEEIFSLNICYAKTIHESSTNLTLERLDLPHLLGDQLPEGGGVGAGLNVGEKVLLVEPPGEALDGRGAGGDEGGRGRRLTIGGGGDGGVGIRVVAAIVAVGGVVHFAVVPPPLHVGKLAARARAVAEFLLLLVRWRWGDALGLKLWSMLK